MKILSPRLPDLTSAAAYSQQLIVGCALRTNQHADQRHKSGAYDAPYDNFSNGASANSSGESGGNRG